MTPEPALICIHAPRPKKGSTEKWGLCLACQEEVDDQMRAAVEEEREAVILAAYTVCPRGNRCRHFQRFEVAIRARGQR